MTRWDGGHEETSTPSASARSLVSEADILAEPDAWAGRLVRHLVEHEVAFETRGTGIVVDLGRGTLTTATMPGAFRIRLEAADRGDLEMLRGGLTALIEEMAHAPLTVRWSGFAEERAAFANFRVMTLVSATRLTPGLRRLTFAGDDLARFASRDDLHVRLFLPPPGIGAPEWPRPGPDGRMLWPPEDRRPAARYYTIRSIDPAAGTIDIDVVLHADAGPGSAFAATAAPGAVVGMMGPLGRAGGTAAWHLLAGDETALPAIARLAEDLPRDARGAILVEVAGPQEEIALAAPPGVSVRWLHRHGAAAGLPDRLMPAVREIVWPADDDVFVWIACELALAKALRRHVAKERGLPRDRFLISGYWSREPA